MEHIANLAETVIFGTIIFLVMCIWVATLSGILYAVLKKFFGKKAAATESEPGQVSKKVKKAAPEAPAPAFIRKEPTLDNFTEEPVLAPAMVAAKAEEADAEADAESVDERDAAAVARDAAFADRMADQFAAEPVTA